MNADLCGSGMEPTLDHKYRTFNLNGTDWFGDWTRFHPWRAPGSARPLDPCGISGGSTKNNNIAGGFGLQTIVHKQGFNGTKLPPAAKPVEWTAGSVQEVSWTIAANHGGGYIYRLCPASSPLTEECFARMPLAFSGESSKLRWQDGHEVETPALRVSTGTFPAGSVWTRNPIPACSGRSGGYRGRGCHAPQFPPPSGCNETCWGYQKCFPGEFLFGCPGGIKTMEIPTIVDRIRVPEVPAGDYVVSWRWDSEHTPQIWSSCGDVKIVPPAAGAAPTAGARRPDVLV